MAYLGGGAGNSIPKAFIMNLFLYHNKMLWLIQYLTTADSEI